jgi:spore coat polysaccharide biosynthesis protein SpsF
MINSDGIWAIVQARLGSTRFPNKMAMYFQGHPILSWSLQRLLRCQNLNGIMLALPNLPPDKAILGALIPKGIQVFYGSPEDLCERFLSAANSVKASKIVRICADNPFVSPELVDELILFQDSINADYAWNHIPHQNNFPDGFGAEICTCDTLQWIAANAKGSQREHLFNCLWEQKHTFKMETYNPKQKKLCRPELKLDIDTWEDLAYLNKFRFTPSMNALEIIEQIDSEVAL